MPLPTTRVVTGHYVNPATGGNATGRVVLTPYPAVWTDETNDQVLTGQGTFALVNGAFSQALVTTDADGVEPATGRLWYIEERISGRPYRRRAFALDAGVGSVDITDLVDADPGEVTYVRGPEGPAGPAGEAGPAGPQPPLGAAGAGPTIALVSTDPTTTNARTPTAHADSHGSAGGDPVTPAAIGAETPAAATAKVTAHAAASDPHGDRAWATGQFYPLADGTALDGFLNDALVRITSLETRMTAAEAETRIAVKTADEQVVSSTSLQDDDHLSLTVVAGGWYAVDGFLDVEGDPAGDITLGWAVPAGATMTWTEGGISAGNTNNIGSIKLQRNDAATSSGVGIVAAGSSVRPAGRLTVGGTAGTLQLRWAQTASSATPTIVKTGSWLRLTRIV